MSNKYKYFVYFNRVYNGKIVGQGNGQFELNKIIDCIEDIRTIEKCLSDDVKEHHVHEIKMSVVIISNYQMFEGGGKAE